LRVIAVASA